MTLIEALVASLILFMAIGLSATVFRQSALLQAKVVKQLERKELSHSIEPYILFQLEQGVTQGEYHWRSKGVSWKAEQLSSTPFAGGYEPEQQSVTTEQGNIVLYQVSVLLTPSNIEQDISYKELVWRP